VICEPSGSVPPEILAGLNVVKGLPTKGKKSLDKKLALADMLIRNELKVTKYLFEREAWDLFFVYSSALDYVQHYFWSFCDANDPSYPGTNGYENVIRSFYVIYDRFVGEVARHLSADQEMMLISDHGHGMRPTILVNVNILLEKEGVLKSRKNNGKTSPMNFAMEASKKLAKKAVNDIGLGNVGMALLRVFPQVRKRIMASSTIDWNSTVAYVSDQSGMKAYSYGGIVVRREMLKTEQDRLATIDRIIGAVKGAKNESGDDIVSWCGRREELYQGRFLDRYPDIVLVLNEGYGLGWETSGPLFSPSTTHSIAPGSHRMSTPVLVLSHRHPELCKNRMLTLSAVYPLICSLMNCTGGVASVRQ